MATYILWDLNSEVFTIGFFTLRWNALLVLLAYFAGRTLLAYMFKKEGKSARDAGVATAYLLVLSLIGARLLYVILEEPQLLWTDPLAVILPFDLTPSFQLVDSFGLSIHGAAFGALLGAWLYYRKASAKRDYRNTLDALAVVAALTGCLLSAGSFLNSEPVGKLTESSVGTAYLQPIKEGLKKIPCCIMRNPNGPNPLSLVVTKKDTTVAQTDSISQGVIMYLFFKPGATEQSVNEFLIGDVKTFLFDMSRFVYEPGTEPLHYSIIVAKDGNYIGRIQTRAFTRFPVHLIQALSCLIIFLAIFLLWRKREWQVATGMCFACFMIFFWSIHLLLGFMKETRTSAELGLDVLLMITGMLFAGASILAHRKKNSPATTTTKTN